jgi:polysaccharide deacetylase 2 family uncharacterized protein YibQ
LAFINAGIERRTVAGAMGAGGVYASSAADMRAAGVMAGGPLPPAPLEAVSRRTAEGILPVIGPGGLTPARAYARPFKASGRPRVAIIVGGLGLDAATTRLALESLPPQVTLAFSPYAPGLQDWINQARARGHEVLLEAPMEPEDYPDNDPGPHTLLASAEAADIQARMNWLLGRATGYFGVTNYMGDRFAASDSGMTAFMTVLRQRGVAFLDDGSMSRRPGAWARASANRIIDEEQNPAAIVGQLNALEALAKGNGQAMGTGFSYPVTVEAVARWTAGMEARGLQLAPASAMTQRPGR